jgi:hypothetical protein
VCFGTSANSNERLFSSLAKDLRGTDGERDTQVDDSDWTAWEDVSVTSLSGCFSLAFWSSESRSFSLSGSTTRAERSASSDCLKTLFNASR